MGRKAAYTLEQLAEDSRNGLKLPDMAAKYGVNVSNISRALKKIRTGAAQVVENALAPRLPAGRTAPSSGAPAPKNIPAPRPQTKPPKNAPKEALDELSMWETRTALDDNFAGVRELLDKRKHPFLDPKTLLRVRAEMRNHIELGVRIMETLYAIQEQAAFQAFVLEVLDEFDDTARERILDRMRERRALRKVCSPDRGTLRPDSH